MAGSERLRDEAVLLVDWLNLSISVKNQRLAFGGSLVTDLLKVATDRTEAHGVGRLACAHFVGEEFSHEAERAISRELIAHAHKTRRVKEQADLVLAVLAMDHLHDDAGCPRIFFLTTGDQDFIPLIQRVVREGASVVLIVGSAANLSADYRSIAAQPNVTLVSIAEVIPLEPIPDVSGERSAACVLGLMRACMDGGILGGAQKANIERLTKWGLLEPGVDPEVRMEGLIRQFTTAQSRRVVRAIGGGRYVPQNRLRTSLDFRRPEVFRTVEDADWVLRRASNGDGANVGSLGVGRFRDDDGTRLDRILAALKIVGWLLELPDGRFEPQLQWSSDGLIEPLWRVVCEINWRAYENEVKGVRRGVLFKTLQSVQIAHDRGRRGQPAANDLIEFAKRLGLIDAVSDGQDGYLLAVMNNHPVAQQMTEIYRSLGQKLGAKIGESMPEHEMLGLMADRDDPSGGSPVFGYDMQDRYRVLRVLRRARLLDRKSDGHEHLVRLKNSRWLRSLLGSGPQEPMETGT